MNFTESQIQEGLYIAYQASKDSNCVRRHYGAAIATSDNVFIGVGSNRTPDQLVSCIGIGYCIREKLNVPHGSRYELCRSIHAEVNAIINTHTDLTELSDCTLFLVGVDPTEDKVIPSEPCSMCKKLIIQNNIQNVIVSQSYVGDDCMSYKVISVNDWIKNDWSVEGVDSYNY